MMGFPSGDGGVWVVKVGGDHMGRMG